MNGGERRAHRGVRRPLFAQEDDEVFVTGSTLYAIDGGQTPPDTTPLVITPLVCCRSWVGWGQDPASWVG